MNVVLVAGSRGYEHLDMVRQAVAQIEHGSLVISGGARGVDTVALAEAKRLGFQTTSYPANWVKYGKAAGFMRNSVMVAQCQEALVFHDGQSRGTQHTLDLLEKAGKPYLLFGAAGHLLLICGIHQHRVIVTRYEPDDPRDRQERGPA